MCYKFNSTMLGSIKEIHILFECWKAFLPFFFFLILFIYLFMVIPCGMWNLNSPTRDQTRTTHIGRWSLNHCTTGEIHRGPSFDVTFRMTAECGAGMTQGQIILGVTEPWSMLFMSLHLLFLDQSNQDSSSPMLVSLVLSPLLW